MSNLELINTEELLHELRNRFAALVVLGVDKGDASVLTEVIDGPAYLCAGMLHQTVCQVTASMTKPLEDE